MNFGARFLNCCRIHWNGFFYFFSPLIILPLIFLEPVVEWRSIFLILWSLIWYVVDVVPVGVIGLLPIIFLPILGVMSHFIWLLDFLKLSSQEVCMSYARDSQILFLLCIFIAATMQHCGIVKRLAFFILINLSCDPRVLLFILMFSSFIFSAILPGAFVCALMMPTVRAILQTLDDISICKSIDESLEPKDDETPYPSNVANAFYIGVAYGINIGCITTAIASDSGLALREVIKNEPSLHQLDFNFHIKYFLISLPVSLTLFIFTIFYLEIIFLGYKRSESLAAQQIAFDRDASKAALEAVGKELPPFNIHMILTALLYFGSCIGLILGSFLNPEINDKVLKYSFNAMLLCFLYFVLPSNCDFCNYFKCSKPSEYKSAASLLSWPVASKLTPWKYFFVHGSSLAFGLLMKNSALHLFIGDGLIRMKNFYAQQIGFMGLTMIFSIMGSNNFVAEIMLNMAVKAVGDNKAAVLMYPIAWSCCLTFLLPVSSTANCFASGWGNLRAKEVLLAGIGPSVFGFLMAILLGSIMGSISFYE